MFCGVGLVRRLLKHSALSSKIMAGCFFEIMLREGHGRERRWSFPVCGKNGKWVDEAEVSFGVRTDRGGHRVDRPGDAGKVALGGEGVGFPAAPQKGGPGR